MAVQLLRKVLDELIKSYFFGAFHVMILPYVCLKRAEILLHVLLQLLDGTSSWNNTWRLKKPHNCS